MCSQWKVNDEIIKNLMMQYENKKKANSAKDNGQNTPKKKSKNIDLKNLEVFNTAL
jgi:hypothetical protein